MEAEEERMKGWGASQKIVGVWEVWIGRMVFGGDALDGGGVK